MWMIAGLALIAGAMGQAFYARWRDRRQFLREQSGSGETLPATDLLSLMSRFPNQLELLLGCMSDALWLVDIRHRQVLYVSDSILRVYGLGKQELLGEPSIWLDIIHPDDRSETIAAIKRMSRGENLDIQHRIICKDGQIGWIHVEGYRLLDAKGHLLVGGISRDITAQRRLGEYWRASEDRYRRVVSLADVCIIVLDDQMRILEWNESAEKIFDVVREEAIGRNYLASFIFEEDHASVVQRANDAMAAGEETYQFQSPVRTASGQRRLLSWNNRFYRNPETGRHETISVGLDITELERVSRDLNDQESLFRSIFENAPVPIAVGDAKGVLTRVNREYERFFEAEPGELNGRSVIDLTHPDDQEKTRDLLFAFFEGGQGIYRFDEKRFITLKGNVRWGSVRAVMHQGSSGSPIMLGQILDITDRKRAEDALKERERQMSALVGNLSGIVYRYSTAVGAGVLRENGQFMMYNLHHDWRPSFISEGAKRITGFRADSFMQADVFSFGHLILPEDRVGLITEVQHSLNAGTPFELVYRIRSATQEIHWLSERGQAFLEPDGSILIEGLLVDITEQRQAEEGEQVYRQLMADTHTGFLTLDRNGLIKDANQPFLDFLGVPHLLMLRNHSTYEWIAPEYKETMVKLLHEVATRGAVKDCEVEYLQPNGRRISLLLSAVASTTDSELLVNCLLFDITQRKKGEQELEQSRNLLAESHRIAGLGSWARVVGDTHLYWADEVYDLLGYGNTHPPATHELLLSHVHQDDRGFVQRQLEQGERIGEPYVSEFRMMRCDDSICYMRNYVNFEHDRMGRVTRVVGVLQDVTSSRLAEQAIRESEKRYRSLFDTSIDGICFISLDGVIEEANAAFLDIVGYMADEIIGMTSEEITPHEWHATDREISEQQILARGYCESYRKEFLRKDGRRVPISIRAWLVKDETGCPLRIMAMVRDVTEFKKIESEREQLQRGLQQAQKMEAIGHLTGGIAHDFNNILTSILGYSDLALRQIGDDPQSRLARYLAQVKTAGERARELISQMLLYSRGGSSIGKVLVIAPVVQSTIKMLRPTLPATIRLRTHINQAISPILVDEVQLQQVVMNLVINARDAMQNEGEIMVMVRESFIEREHCASCHARVEGTYVEVLVRDKGEGIDPVLLNRIFDPFFTTKEVGKGSGMGLSVVHGIVHEFGGHILVNSRPHEGTTFRVLFKRQHDVAPDAPVGERHPALPYRNRDHRVLVVDDEPSVANMIGDLLTLQGFQVEVVTDSLQALEMIKSAPNSFDGMVCDHVMPGLVGYELVLKAREIRPDFPVVLCSAQAELLARQTARPMNWPVLSKPIDPEQLVRTLEAVLHMEHVVPENITPQ